MIRYLLHGVGIANFLSSLTRHSWQCTKTVLHRRFAISSTHSHLYNHVRTGLCVYCYVSSSCRTLFQPHRGSRWRTHETLSLFINTKFYSLLNFLSSCREKETAYENWITHVSWTNRNNVKKGERKSRHKPWIFFLVFCCSCNMVVHWFHLHSCTSSRGPLFGAHPKMRAATFGFLHIVLASVHCCLYLVTFLSPINF